MGCYKGPWVAGVVGEVGCSKIKTPQASSALFPCWHSAFTVILLPYNFQPLDRSYPGDVFRVCVFPFYTVTHCSHIYCMYISSWPIFVYTVYKGSAGPFPYVLYIDALLAHYSI